MTTGDESLEHGAWEIIKPGDPEPPLTVIEGTNFTSYPEAGVYLPRESDVLPVDVQEIGFLTPVGRVVAEVLRFTSKKLGMLFAGRGVVGDVYIATEGILGEITDNEDEDE